MTCPRPRPAVSLAFAADLSEARFGALFGPGRGGGRTDLFSDTPTARPLTPDEELLAAAVAWTGPTFGLEELESAPEFTCLSCSALMHLGARRTLRVYVGVREGSQGHVFAVYERLDGGGVANVYSSDSLDETLSVANRCLPSSTPPFHFTRADVRRALNL